MEISPYYISSINSTISILSLYITGNPGLIYGSSSNKQVDFGSGGAGSTTSYGAGNLFSNVYYVISMLC